MSFEIFTLIMNTEAIHVAEDVPASQTDVVDADIGVSKEVSQPLENGNLSVTEKVVPVDHVKECSHQEHHSHAEKAASNNSLEDTPKKSFASIVSFIHLFTCLQCIFFKCLTICDYLHLFVSGECTKRKCCSLPCEGFPRETC